MLLRLLCSLTILSLSVSLSSAPTTASPTAPTTTAPTTAPTTEEPTHAPTTPAPTIAPTTAVPTTSEPTAAPTTPVPSIAPTTSAPTTHTPTTHTPTLNLTVAPSSTPTGPQLPVLRPFVPFAPRQPMNSTLINLTFDVENYQIRFDADFLRRLKGNIFTAMNFSTFPRGPPIDIINVRQRNDDTMTLSVVMEESYTNALITFLGARNGTNCTGYLCSLLTVSASEVTHFCSDIGWARTCPTGCAHTKCADNVNNKCILSADGTGYSCSCLSMGYRTGANSETCDALPQVGIGGVIAVAVICFIAGVVLMIVVWKRYTRYQKTLKDKDTSHIVRPTQRGRPSPGDAGRRLSSSVSQSTRDSSRRNSRLIRSSTSRGLTRSPSPSTASTKHLNLKPMVNRDVPHLDPFKHPVNNNFQQMNFSGEKKRFSRLQAFTVFFSATCALVPSGLGLIIVTTDIVRQEMRYDNLPDCDLLRNPQGTVCLVTMTIEQDMAAPIHVHYRLNGFYQNHRSYVMSRDEKQLRNQSSFDSALPNCEPLNTGEGMFSPPAIKPSFQGNTSTPPPSNFSTRELQLYPCGLVAQSWFNDEFIACHRVQNESFCDPFTADDWAKEGIIYEWDKQKKFVDRPLTPTETKWNHFLGYEMPSLEDEDFIVWMRVAPRSAFSKFYREIKTTSLLAGDQVTFAIKSSYPVEVFGGSKSIVLSTASFFGGKTTALGQLYVVVGILSAIIAVILWLFGGREAHYRECCKKSRHDMTSPLGGGIRLD